MSFLIEDIHAIGERRPFLTDEASLIQLNPLIIKSINARVILKEKVVLHAKVYIK
jgi:hypothetical protein